MTITTNRVSAYPPAIEELLPQARDLASRLGTLPSRNRLKTELRVGAPKAAAVRDALADAGFTPPPPPPTDPDPAITEPVTVEPQTTVAADPINEPDPPGPPPGPPTEEPVRVDASPLPTVVVDPVPTITPPTAPAVSAVSARVPRAWPVLLLALPAFVAIWSGWVGLGGLTGFGTVHPLPGIWDSLRLNTAITLPIGVETYAAYALRAWLSPGVPVRARRFARTSAIGSLMLGAAGQVAYHLMAATGMTHAPWQITTAVACLPVAVLGMGAALTHLLHTDPDQ